MLVNIFTIFMAILLYFVFKIIYNVVLLLLIAKVFAQIKAKGSETLDEFKKNMGGQENGETR